MLDKNNKLEINRKIPLTQVERNRNYRKTNCVKQHALNLDVQSVAAMVYLKKQWGFKSNSEAMRAALRYLAVQTRTQPGLTKLFLEV